MVLGDRQLNQVSYRGWAPQVLALSYYWLIGWFLMHLAATAPINAQPIPLSDDFQVNSLTAGSQKNADAAAAVGHFIVVWRSSLTMAGDPSFGTVQMRIMDHEGIFVGKDFQVNTYTATLVAPSSPRVAGTAEGFAVVWSVEELSYPASDVRARAFLLDGSPVADDFRVNVSTAIPSGRPDVAAAPDGRFLVVWSRGNLSFTPTVDGRLFLSDGTPLTDEFTISVELPARFPAVAATPSGEFVVTWSGSDGDFQGVKTRKVSADGVPTGPEFLVNTYTTGPQSTTKVAVNSAGEALVVYKSGLVFTPPQRGSTNVWARRLDPSGMPVAGEFQVAQTPGYDNIYPVAAFDNDDNALIVWQSYGDNSKHLGGQILSRSGSLLPADFVANSYPTGDEVLPSIGGPLDDGTILLAWSSIRFPGPDTSNDGVVGRFFRGLITAPPPIPTLGHLGLIAFALLLALAALRVVRR